MKGSTSSRLLATHALLVYLFLYGPIAILVLFSFNSARYISVWQGFSLRWYTALWHNDEMLECMRNSVIVGTLATIVATIVGTLAALSLSRGRSKPITSALLYLPIIIPEIVIGAATLTFFSVTRWPRSLMTIMIAHVTFSISYVAIVVRARLAGFDRSLEEAAMDLGAGPLATFWRVKLPLMLPGIIASALLVFTLSIDDYVITSFVAGPQSQTLPLLIASKLHVKNDLPMVNAAATMLLLLTVLLIAISQWLLGERKANRLLLRREVRFMKTMFSLLGVGCAALAVLIAGCNKNTTSTASAGPDKVVNLYSWSNYFPPETLKQFTAQTGIKVNSSNYSLNEELIAKLSANDAGYDIVIPSDYAVQILIAEKKIVPLDRTKLPNFKNLDPKLLGLVYDKENKYSFPIFWGTTGLGINRDVMKDPIDSWSVLFDEKNAGKISMLNDPRENFAVALKLMGKSVNESDPAVLKQAAEKLKAHAKLVKAYDSDSFDEKLRGGDAALVHGYNGQLAKIVAEKPEKFAYIVPKEGATRWVDNACIPTGAKNAENAHIFLNYILDAKVAADMVNEVAYASANQAAKPMIKAEIVNDKNIYVPDDVLAHCELMQDLGQTAPMVQKLWEEIKSK